MKVSQEPQKLSSILEDKYFKVPLYQREYSWTLNEVSDLYYDILESLKEEEGHFFGSLLLYKPESKKEVEIVDGQQRLTTIFLLLYAILKEIEFSNKTKAIDKIRSLLFVVDSNNLAEDFISTEPRLETGKRDRKLFKAIISGKDYESYKDGRKKSHKNLNNTLDFFSERIAEIKKDKGLEGVVDLTQSIIKSEFIVMTAEKESDRLLLFKTINSRGLELTQADMIKNELCHCVLEEEIDDFVEQWDEIRGELEKNSGNLDTFLFHYINSIDEAQDLRREKDKKRGISNWDKKNYPPVPEKLVFDIYCDLLNKKSAQDFIDDLKLAVNHYVRLINPENNDVNILGLKAMGVNKCFPLLLRASKKLSNSDFCKIADVIEALTFRHSILRKDPKELERFYYQQSESIESGMNLNEFLDKIREHANFREEERFRSEFLLASPKASVAKMILSRIVRFQCESVDWSNKDTHIEHIMPQTPKGEWLELYEKDSIEYNDYLNRIGNLTILQDKKNIKARNKDFSEKKPFYSNSRLRITLSLIDYETWNYSTISKRQEDLFEIVREIWK